MQRLLFAILSKIVVGRARIIPLKTNIHPSLMLMSTSTIITASDNVSSLSHEPSWKNFVLPSSTEQSDDWIQDLELDSAKNFMIEEAKRSPCKILVLYGSLRSESYSKKLAYECARVLTYLGCDVRVFDPRDLPQHMMLKIFLITVKFLNCEHYLSGVKGRCGCLPSSMAPSQD